MRLDRSIFAELERIHWFSHCGEATDKNLGKCLSSWKEAECAFSSSTWEEVTAEAQGRLTEYLSKKWPQMYQGEWNSLVREARPIVETVVTAPTTKLIEEHDLNALLLDCVKWDILHAVMERSYRQCKPPTFFEELLEVYKVGKLPCGWDGEWPNGNLLIF